MKSAEAIIAEALAAGRNTLSEYDSKQILAAYGIPTTKEFLKENFPEVEQAADNIGYPVALKVCASAAQHKSEMGLIELGIKDAAELKRAYDHLAPKARDLGGVILVQEMVAGSRELVAGLIRDPQFGPCVMFGLGGIFTEALGNDVIKNILANEFSGKLYLVNPKGGEILGHRVYPSIQDLPEAIDLAIIILPATATPQAIRDCAAKGAKAIVMAASGFAEVDEQGEKLQQETIQAIRETGVRAIGPNTSGHTSTPHNFTSSFFPLGKVPRGHVSYLAQTGNFATHTMRYIISGEHFGVARVLGMGNKLDVEESEVLEYYGRDPETRAIFVYLESFKKPRRFLEVARQVTRSKPVILMITEETGVPSLEFIVELAQRYPAKPLYVTFSGQKKHMDAAKAYLEPRGVPTFPLIEQPFEVLSILARCRNAMR